LSARHVPTIAPTKSPRHWAIPPTFGDRHPKRLGRVVVVLASSLLDLGGLVLALAIGRRLVRAARAS